MIISEHPRAHPNTTSSEVAKGMNKKTSAVIGVLSQLCTTDWIVKLDIRNDISTYRINDILFGCSSSLITIFNQLLNGVRRGTMQ